MIVALSHDELIAFQIFSGHEPGLAVAAIASPQADAFALSEGVERQSQMLAYRLALRGFHRAGLRGQVAAEKVAKRALADEADAGGVFFAGVVQAYRFGHFAHFGLVQLAHRKQRARELRLIESVQKVALVFRGVQPAQQLEAVVGLTYPRVMSGGDAVCAQAHGMVEKGLELDLGVAQHVWVGRASGGIFAQKFGKHPLFVFRREIHRLDVDADTVGHARGVEPVLTRGAVFAVIVVFPVFHEQANDRVTLLFEQPGGHGGIDTAGKADYNDAARRRCHAQIVERRLGSTEHTRVGGDQLQGVALPPQVILDAAQHQRAAMTAGTGAQGVEVHPQRALDALVQRAPRVCSGDFAAEREPQIALVLMTAGRLTLGARQIHAHQAGGDEHPAGFF